MSSPTIGDRWGDFEASMLENGAHDEHITAMRHAFAFGVAITIARYWALMGEWIQRPGELDMRVSIVDLLQEEFDKFNTGEGRTLQ